MKLDGDHLRTILCMHKDAKQGYKNTAPWAT